MANFTYHPPTRDHCAVCEILLDNKSIPIMDKLNGKASSASNFPVHNWYYFVLGYTPAFPDFILEREGITSDHFVVDPFMGSGTTLIACKHKEIPSAGIDANDYFIDVVKTKTHWDIDIDKAICYRDTIISYVTEIFNNFKSKSDEENQDHLFEKKMNIWEDYTKQNRQKMMDSRYMSDIPFAKLHILKQQIDKIIEEEGLKSFFSLAISSIIVPISNVNYGPGFGISKAKFDVDVLDIFTKKINRMIDDMKVMKNEQRETPVEIKHGDSREIDQYFPPESVDLMITSPPYPGDHEYTKHTRLELIFMGYASDIHEFRTIKKRMIRGSTTNMYKEDKDRECVRHFKSIEKVTQLIEERLIADNATSGFEKLYTKLVWEYFGGMYRMLSEAKKVLKRGGKISLLVSDSHAFKMVHIPTADILAEIGIDIGYCNAQIELWQDKISTSHTYHLRENILTLTK
jgi:DNA modification methylase